MTDRHCGSCTLCCRLVPVEELKKTAGERCAHQRHTGCAIYQRRPQSCRLWSCQWRLGTDTEDQLRPDRSHCVIDCMPDVMLLNYGDGTEKVPVQAVQIWVDDRYPDAHRAPAIRAYMQRQAAKGIATMVRFDRERGIGIFPPGMFENQGDVWVEKVGDTSTTEPGELRRKYLYGQKEKGEL